jgi:hypothetical protein
MNILPHSSRASGGIIKLPQLFGVHHVAASAARNELIN